jgi:hypothetical protein
MTADRILPVRFLFLFRFLFLECETMATSGDEYCSEILETIDLLVRLASGEVTEDDQEEEYALWGLFSLEPGDTDGAQQQLEEMPLSVEYRSDWCDSRENCGEAGEMRVILTCGGPWCAITAELWGDSVKRARIEYREAGQPNYFRSCDSDSISRFFAIVGGF